MNNAWRALVKRLLVVLLPTILILLPVPAGVTSQAWRLLAIFVGTILGLMLQPLPLGAMTLVGLAAAALTGALPPGSRRHYGLSACLDTHRSVEYERKWNPVQVRRALEVSRP